MSDDYEIIREILTTQFSVPDAEIRPDATLEKLEMDSLALAEFALILEEQHAIRVQSELATGTTTLAEVAEHVRHLRAGTTANQ